MTPTVREFLDQIKDAPVPDGFGLVFIDRRRTGHDIIQVDNPRFMFPLPLEDQNRLKRLLIISPDIAGSFIEELDAQPVETMADWYRFAMWEQVDEQHRH